MKSVGLIIRYDVAGGASPDSTAESQFTAQSSTVEEPLVLVKTPFGRRFTGQFDAPFMAPTAVARQWGGITVGWLHTAQTCTLGEPHVSPRLQ
jgi:hypothetical protein